MGRACCCPRAPALTASGVGEYEQRVDLIKFRPFLYLLLVLNAVVLLGQLWPEGAPPFARIVNILFLTLTLATLLARVLRRKS